MKRFLVMFLMAMPVVQFAYASGDSGVPGGSAYENSEYASPRRRNRNAYISHVVGTGETVYSVLVRYGLPLSVLRADNPGIPDNNEIKAGETLRINKSRMGSVNESQIAAEIAADARIRELSERETETVESQEEVQTGEYDDNGGEMFPIEVDAAGFVHHEVVAGETLFGISRYYGVSVPVIREKNSDKLADGLKIGTVLLIPIDMSMIYNGEMLGRPVHFIGTDYDAYEGERPLKRFGTSYAPINVALMLPMTSGGDAKMQFSEFYQGVLIALDSIKREGASVNLKLYDTSHDSSKIYSLISSGDMADVDLMIGPVYGDTFGIMAEYARARKIPIVSPLAEVNCADNPYVYQMAPDASAHYDKIAPLLHGKHVVIIDTGDDDSLFVDYVRRHTTDYSVLSFDRTAKPDVIVPSMPYGRETVFVVASKSKEMTDQVISKLLGLKMLTAGHKHMSVVVSSRISRMGLDPASLFRLGVNYVTSYHVDRSDLLVRKFDADYIRRFGKVPSLYAYKGYDVAMFFFGTMLEMGSGFGDYMDNYYTTILQSRYKFRRVARNGKFVNTEWVLVNYSPSYNIYVR
ncbi:MAG: LysM peptidoglycan-binding domain-containing protein [Rikenellaceae bacterium]|nr:LysM peptidoglycan-binding domain-containing protein [Rikenellaceae bacterium]